LDPQAQHGPLAVRRKREAKEELSSREQLGFGLRKSLQLLTSGMKGAHDTERPVAVPPPQARTNPNAPTPLLANMLLPRPLKARKKGDICRGGGR